MQFDEPEQEDQPKKPNAHKRRRAIFRSVGSTVLTLLFVGGVFGSLLALFHPDTPLPDEWNPTAPLDVTDPMTHLTTWKLRRVLADPSQCVATLGPVSNVGQRPPLEVSESCHIRNRVALSQVGRDTTISPPLMETSCATALRLAMWEFHGVQPAAREILQSNVSAIRQIGSYNCRPIRTSNGDSTRWSTHSTGDAIDITGFDFSDGRRIRLINDWNDGTEEAQFLRAVRDSACKWFATTLSPDYNSLHADHFHLQARGWGTCR